MIRRPPRAALFPSTTLFRSVSCVTCGPCRTPSPCWPGRPRSRWRGSGRLEEHTSYVQSLAYLVCRLLFVNDTATTESCTLSLHDALPICELRDLRAVQDAVTVLAGQAALALARIGQIGRAHVLCPVTSLSRMPSFVC